MNPFIKRVSFALILAGSISNGLAWSWGSLKEAVNSAQPSPAADESNPFVGKIFIKPFFKRDFYVMKFTSDTGAVYVDKYQGHHDAVSYSVDITKRSLKFDGVDYKYTINGKVLRLDTIDSSEEWYEIPLPPFYNSSEFQALDTCLNEDKAKIYIDNIIKQAKGESLSTPSPTPSPTPANSPVTYTTAPTATPTPDQAPASLALSYAIATTTTAVSVATPTPANSPITETPSLSGYYNGVMSDMNGTREFPLELIITNSPSGQGIPAQYDIGGKINLPKSHVHGTIKGKATVQNQTQLFFTIQGGTHGIASFSGVLAGNSLVGTWQVISSNGTLGIPENFHAERQDTAPQSTSPTGIDYSVSVAPSGITPDTTSLPAGTAQIAAPQNVGTENTAAEAIQKMTNFGQISSTPNHDAKRNEEMFPQTRLRALDATEISMMNVPRLQCAINEMFARYGFVFQNQSIQKLFEEFSWYQPNPNRTQKDIISQFSQLEINNLNLLIDAQKNLSSKIEMNSTTLVAKSKAHSKANVKVYSTHEKFPPDIIGKGVAGSFVLIQEAIGGGAMIVPAEDAMFPLAGRKFIVQNKTSGFPRGTVIPIQKQVRLNYSPANPLIITGKGPLPGFYTVKAP